MDLENQKRVKEFAEQYGPENVVVILGAAEGEAAGLAAETVTAGDPTFAGPLAGVQLMISTTKCSPSEISIVNTCNTNMGDVFTSPVFRISHILSLGERPCDHVL